MANKSRALPNIAFLALDDIHHLHHIAPIAFELSQDEKYRCVLYLQAHSLPLANQIANLYPGHHCEIKILSLSLFRRALRWWRRGIIPARHLIKQHARELLTYDGIVTPDMNLEWLIQQSHHVIPAQAGIHFNQSTGAPGEMDSRLRGNDRPKFFLTFHGGGNRERPFHLLRNYDVLFLYSEKRREEFERAGYLKKIDYAVTGYPKFDKIPADFHPKLFNNNKPVILYNPHFDLKISSWDPWGLKILEYFYQQKTFNFIFAPHCNLFQRHVSRKKIPKKYFSAAHMLIDLGSEKSADMTYTQAADIYIGDVSSQVFEFIRRPRPCFFLNAFQAPVEKYRAWRCGTVINDLPALYSALKQSVILNPHELEQKKCFTETFSVTSELAAHRIATVIKSKLNTPVIASASEAIQYGA